jgi:amino acid transporter
MPHDLSTLLGDSPWLGSMYWMFLVTHLSPADISSYALSWLVTLPLEIVAASITMSFWSGAQHVNQAVWVTIFLLLIIRLVVVRRYPACVLTKDSINLFGVKGYGEAEFVFSIIKVTAVIGFIILGM